mmetsp:Transcript_115671/g.367769  ORF Transcript_115671/g.367769 Transcript_115671/m.367769 type:complete len:230 (+) Transcript_115671:325-1014(+)
MPLVDDDATVRLVLDRIAVTIGEGARQAGDFASDGIGDRPKTREETVPRELRWPTRPVLDQDHFVSNNHGNLERRGRLLGEMLLDQDHLVSNNHGSLERRGRHLGEMLLLLESLAFLCLETSQSHQVLLLRLLGRLPKCRLLGRHSLHLSLRRRGLLGAIGAPCLLRLGRPTPRGSKDNSLASGVHDEKVVGLFPFFRALLLAVPIVVRACSGTASLHRNSGAVRASIG